MNDVLEKMNPEKKVALINAAMKVFSENSFKKASTNAIVKEAGISKGLLYHYFSSKDELFQYLIDYAMNFVAGRIATEIGYEERDIIERIRKIVELKLELVNEFPALVPFSKVMYEGMDYEEIRKLIEKYQPIPIEMYYQHNVDETLFRDGVDVSMAVKTIQFTLEKVSDQYVTQRKMGLEPDLNAIMQEINMYLDHFRSTYYKEEASV